MSIVVFKNPHSPRKIDHPKYITLEMITITVDDSFHNYFKDSFLADVICDFPPSDISKTRKTTFTLCRALKEPH